MPPAWPRPLACLALAALALQCSELKETPAPAPDEPASPEQEAWGWSSVVTRRGVPRVDVRAAHLIQPNASEAVALDGGVTVFFFDGQGRDTVSTLRSERALLDADGDSLRAIGGVVLTSRDSTRLQTDTLVWSRESDRITGDGRVRIVRPDGEETGVGFEADPDLGRWSMRKVTTRLRQPSATP